MTGMLYSLMFRVGCNRLCTVWNKILAKFLNYVFPLWCKIFSNHKGINKEKREQEIIVSLTSFPERFGQLHLCIESLMRQSVKPDKIVLWLIEEECKNVEITKQLLELTNFGLEIRFAKINLKPHNKFIFSAMEFKNSIIITADDDIIYPSYMIEELLIGYSKHSNCIICNMAHEITLDDLGKPNPYNQWNGGAIGKMGPSFNLTALGVGGVLYPPNIFDDEYFNMELIKELSLTADDLWLKYNETKLKYKVFKIKEHTKNPITISKTQEIALTDLNNGNGRNNEIISKLNEHFDINWNDLFKN